MKHLLMVITLATLSCSGEAPPKPPRQTRRTTVVEQPAPEDAAPPSGPASSVAVEGRPVLIDFTRDHCLPCEIMAPWVAQLRKELDGKVDVTEMNIDRPGNKELGLFFKVGSIPTQVYIDAAGKEVSRQVGLATKPQMVATMRKLGFIE